MRLITTTAVLSLFTFNLPVLLSAAPAARLNLEELRAVIQTNLPGVTPADIEQRAAEGLLRGFRGKVQLVESPDTPTANRTNLSQITVIDGGIGYVRVAWVGANLNSELARHLQIMDATNKLKGLVLDLRFGKGEDYAAAVATADLFVTAARDLLDYGSGMMRSSAKTNALTWPVVALVNGETTGAPEALAALLRETGAGLILGSPTIGAAMTTKEITLGTGQRVRVAAHPVKLGGGTPLPSTGVVPDIQVNVSPADERAYWSDPYNVPAHTLATTNVVAGGTNRPARRPRTNEADLVRARREGLDPNDEMLRPRESEPEAPVIRDPALGRAVDLLKGLAVVRRAS
jgi:hypothetical protein